MHNSAGYPQFVDVDSETIAVGVADDPRGDGFPELWFHRAGESIARKKARLRWSDLVEDLVQAAKQTNFARLKNGKYDPAFRWEQWTTTTSQHAIADECRAKRWRGTVKQWWDDGTVIQTNATFDPHQPPAGRTFGADLNAAAPDPYDETVMDDTSEVVAKAYAAMSNDTHRAVLWMMSVEGFTGEETAAELGMSVRAVYNAHSRAKKKLTALIEVEAMRRRLIEGGE